uniref:Uncharacterized protein n=1 Tax=Ciona intestinalis TaxID=7719 RepID=F6YQM2_CIOIN
MKILSHIGQRYSVVTLTQTQQLLKPCKIQFKPDLSGFNLDPGEAGLLFGLKSLVAVLMQKAGTC